MKCGSTNAPTLSQLDDDDDDDDGVFLIYIYFPNTSCLYAW
jgi:hypothetical protein